MSPTVHDREARTSHFTRRRPLFWLALAFSGGIVLDRWFSPALPQLGGLALALFTAILLAWSFRRALLMGRAGLALAAVLGLSAGALNHALRGRIPPPDDVSRRTSALPSLAFIEGTIIESRRPRHEGDRAEWTLALSRLGFEPGGMSPVSGRVALRAPGPSPASPSEPPPVAQTGQSLPTAFPAEGTAGPKTAAGAEKAEAEGDVIFACARLEAPPELSFPGGFDLAEYLRQQGVRRVGEVLPGTLEFRGRAAWRVDLTLRRWSTTLSERIESALPDDETGSSRAALLNALLFGRRERVSAGDREAFAQAGTAHLLAISGLQIQFFAVALFCLLSMCGLRRRRCAWIVLGACMAYCALAGADAPILRATIMIAFYFAAVLLWREPDLLSILGAASLAILAAAPEQLFSAGFQLSFAAVLSLVALLPVLNSAIDAWSEGARGGVISVPRPPWMLSWREWAMLRLRQPALLTAAATLGTAPIVAWHMGRVSLFALCVNLLAVPLSSLCMLAGLILLAVASLPLLAAAASGTALFLVGLLQGINYLAAQMPGAAIDVPPPPAAALIAYLAALALLWRARPSGIRAGQAALACGLCLALLFSGAIFRERAEAPSVTLLDMARGRAALVEAPDGGAALIDAGGPGEGPHLAALLREKGIRRLALLVLSADEPGALGGALELLRRVPAARVLLPRSSGATSARRELEAWLAARGIPYGAPGIPGAAAIMQIAGPSSVRWQLCDDNPVAGPPRAAAALAIRLELPGRTLLLADAHSGAATLRLLEKFGGRMSSDVLCLSCSGARWPQETARLVEAAQCRTLVLCGRDPLELAGPDLAQLAQARQIQMFVPGRDGSLRFNADTGIAAAPGVQAFRNGRWLPASR